MRQVTRHEMARNHLPTIISQLDSRFTSSLHRLIDQLQFYANTETHRLVNLLTRLDYNLFYSRGAVAIGLSQRKSNDGVASEVGSNEMGENAYQNNDIENDGVQVEMQ